MKIAKKAMPAEQQQAIRTDYIESGTIDADNENREYIVTEEISAHFTSCFIRKRIYSPSWKKW